MTGHLHDYAVSGLFSQDIIRLMSALSAEARMHRIVAEADTDRAEAAWHQLEAAHCDRIRGALSHAKAFGVTRRTGGAP